MSIGNKRHGDSKGTSGKWATPDDSNHGRKRATPPTPSGGRKADRQANNKGSSGSGSGKWGKKR